jgi:hypothetical protein
LLSRSAALTCGVTDRNNIPRDSYHIVGHGQLQPWNRTDPGAAWPWSSYLDQVKDACGDNNTSGGGSGSGSGGSGSGSGGTDTGDTNTPTADPTESVFIIDSNNTMNQTDWYKIEVSSAWQSSTAISGFYNTGYWVAPTESVSDAASFWFYSNTATCYTVDAWWTASSSRSTAVSWMGWDASDQEVGRSTVNMQTNGSRWNTLGTWNFSSGWNRVLLSRWAASGSYVVADAVRVTPCQ